MGVYKTIDHVQMWIKKPNPSQGPPASFKACNQDLKDMDVLRTFKIKSKGILAYLSYHGYGPGYYILVNVNTIW